MTSLAKIEANRRNAQLSTGPRTPEGKAAVARNTITHGIFAAVPVVLGESADAWEAHRAGVVASLAPIGLLEVNLAERAALLLWRLQRLARYEAETVAGSMEDAEVPPLPAPQTPLSRLCPEPAQQTRAEQLMELRAQRDQALREHGCLTAARERLANLGSPAPMGYEVAAVLLEVALGRAETADGLVDDPPRFDTRTFLRRLGRAEPDARSVPWDGELLRGAVELYAQLAREPLDAFLAVMRGDLDDRVGDTGREVRRLERGVAAVVRRLDTQTARAQAAQLLPPGGADERIGKYERHLHNLLTSTLHELERLQARRGGEPVTPPAVADINLAVTVDPG